MGYEAFVVDGHSRDALALKYPPKFPQFIGHHITHNFGVRRNPTANYGAVIPVRVVGYVCNDDGLETFLIEVNGTTTRLDGVPYHLTWSLDRARGFRPVDSKHLVVSATRNINPPITVMTTFEYIQ